MFPADVAVVGTRGQPITVLLCTPVGRQRPWFQVRGIQEIRLEVEPSSSLAPQVVSAVPLLTEGKRRNSVLHKPGGGGVCEILTQGVAMWVGHGDGHGGIITVLKQDTRETHGAPSLPWWGHGSVQSGFLSGLRLSEAFLPSRGRGLPARGLRPPAGPVRSPETLRWLQGPGRRSDVF